MLASRCDCSLTANPCIQDRAEVGSVSETRHFFRSDCGVIIWLVGKTWRSEYLLSVILGDLSVGKFRLLYCPFQMSCGSPLHAIVGRIKSTPSCEILDQSAKSEVSLKYPLVFVQRSAVNHLSHYICIWMQKISQKQSKVHPRANIT